MVTLPVSSTFGGSATAAFVSLPTESDPYTYQVGFGNRFACEAVAGALPQSQNTPQKCKYDLYSEQLNGTSFISSRSSMQHAWFYRIRPSAARKAATKTTIPTEIQASFAISNSEVEFSPESLTWRAFPFPSSEESVDFVEGLKTMAGSGDPMIKEGLAVYMYSANRSMGNRAFCSNDGDMLIVPQEGRLDIQTEFGRMMVRPGEIVVIQAGMRFKIVLPDGQARGYIQEIFGSHYELPELGPIGSNGMALPRDFEIPLASFDLDQSPWEVIYKLAGNLYVSKQGHTPFDVVAWHGNYAPYKYAVEKFVNCAVVAKDQSDPTVYTVLTARSKIPGVPLTEVMMFTPKWTVNDSFRPPYYHRNMATEIMGLVYGKYGGSSKDLQVGGLSFQPSYLPHGESYEVFKNATTKELKPEWTGEGSLAFMFHISAHCAVTKFALERSGVLLEENEKLWDDLEGGFINHVEEINEDQKRRGLSPLGSQVS